MAMVPNYARSQGEPTDSITTTAAVIPAQTQLEYLTERLALSTERIVAVHQGLNGFFSTTFGHTATEIEATQKGSEPTPTSTLNLLQQAEIELVNALDILEADMQFLQEQNL